MFYLVLLLTLPASLFSLICTSCPFKLHSPHSLDCNDTCEGDVCYIVVNQFFNGTIIAGCLSATTSDFVHKGASVCHRKLDTVLCACTSADKCNSPTSPLAQFDFTDEEILEGQQIFPQIQPTESPLPEPVNKLVEPLRAPADNKTEATKGQTSHPEEKTTVSPSSNKTITRPSATTPTTKVSAELFSFFSVIILCYFLR